MSLPTNWHRTNADAITGPGGRRVIRLSEGRYVAEGPKGSDGTITGGRKLLEGEYADWRVAVKAAESFPAAGKRAGRLAAS